MRVHPSLVRRSRCGRSLRSRPYTSFECHILLEDLPSHIGGWSDSRLGALDSSPNSQAHQCVQDDFTFGKKPMRHIPNPVIPLRLLINEETRQRLVQRGKVFHELLRIRRRYWYRPEKLYGRRLVSRNFLPGQSPTQDSVCGFAESSSKASLLSWIRDLKHTLIERGESENCTRLLEERC